MFRGAQNSLVRSLVPLIAAAAGICAGPAAQGQPVPAVISTTQPIWYRTTLAGYTSPWEAAPSHVSMNIAAPSGGSPGAVTIQNLRVSATLITCAVGVPASGGVAVTGTNFVLNVAPGSGYSFAGQSGSPGQTLFASAGLPGAAQGIVNYLAGGLACTTLSGGGAPCQGPLSLGAPIAPACAVSSGVVNGAASPKTVSLTLNAIIPLAPGATWGSLEVWVPLEGTFEAGAVPNPCPADFNQLGGVTVADIFAFLSAWFAADPRANFNGTGGVTVADIFAFLTAWFAGC